MVDDFVDGGTKKSPPQRRVRLRSHNDQINAEILGNPQDNVSRLTEVDSALSC